MNSTSVEVTAGMGGFLVLFGLMIVVWLLGRDLTRRLRRMRLAEDQRVGTVLREREERGREGHGGRDEGRVSQPQDREDDGEDRDPIG